MIHQEQIVETYCELCNEPMVIMNPTDVEFDDNTIRLLEAFKVAEFVVFECKKCDQHGIHILSVEEERVPWV